MLIETTNGVMYRIHFKNCTIYINSAAGVFLSKDKNILSIKRRTNRILVNKFKICSWDEITENLSHIKFLIKYSPIFSKLVDLTEFNTIEFCNPEFRLVRYYICCNKSKYFNVFETNYGNFTIKYDSEFDDCVKLINEEM